MRVAIDDQIFVTQRHGGVSRYFTELIRQFTSDDALGVDLVLPWYWTKNEHAHGAAIGRTVPERLASRTLLNLLNSPYRGRRHSVDVLHHTYYMPDSQALWSPRSGASPARAITVYDMIPELFPEWFPHGSPHQAKHRYVAEADLIICISESTRTDLLKYYDRVPGRVEVIPLAVDERFTPNQAPLDGWPESYVLFVGSRNAYKDFRCFATAFAKIASESVNLCLLALGGGPFTPEEDAMLRSLGIRNRAFQSTLDDQRIANAYAHAIAFVFPSHYEGFGLPTLEAMASGCPVLLTDSSSMREVGGEAAVYFPPGDSDALAEALDKVIGDSQHRECLIARGLAQASRFSWSATALRTAEAYRDIVGERM